MIKRKTHTQHSFEDVKRSMRKKLALLYIVIIIGLLIQWYLERNPVWMYVVIASITALWVIIAYFTGIGKAEYFFNKKQNSYELPKFKK